MSSTNEELPPKPRVSPLDFRNTDLVSRLLAATPPYLYNMPIVPNSYFFSEMLRSLVQAKTEASNRVGTPISLQHRRSRKRSWTQSRSEYYNKMSPKNERLEQPQMSWSPRQTIPEKNGMFDNKSAESPLELIMHKVPTPNSSKTVTIDHNDDNKLMKMIESSPKQEPSNNNIPMMYPSTISSSAAQEANLILPPPPIWYPSLYPTPYGIDPLHFFIDLRVSGHIYDRKNQKDAPNLPQSHLSPKLSATPEQSSDQELTQSGPSSLHNINTLGDGFKQSRHASAFSVPVPNLMKNIPINLSNEKYPKEQSVSGIGEKLHSEPKNTKFDVKSMGFDKSYSKTSTSYVMKNISNIYKNLQNNILKSENEEIQVDEPLPASEDDKDYPNETEEEKQKRVKDLRALIGLELVVDYMNHTKPRQTHANFEDSSLDTESRESSSVEVVSVEETNQHALTY